VEERPMARSFGNELRHVRGVLPVVPAQKLSNIASAAFVTRRERKSFRHNEHIEQ
jgi:hypothetical protein